MHDLPLPSDPMAEQPRIRTRFRKWVAGLSVIAATTAIGVGCSIFSEANLAIYWFAAATFFVGVGVVAWEEVGSLAPFERWVVTALVIVVSWLGFYKACEYVIRKAEENARLSITQDVKESLAYAQSRSAAKEGVSRGKGKEPNELKGPLPARTPGGCKELDACPPDRIKEDAMKIADAIDEIYNNHDRERKKILDQFNSLPNDQQTEDRKRSTGFLLDVSDDRALEIYRAKYRSNAQKYRQVMERLIGPNVHDARVDDLYDIKDGHTDTSSGRTVFTFNWQLHNLPQIAGDLRSLASQLQPKE